MRGQPDTPTPPHIVAAANQALRDGLTGYPDNQGEAVLRKAVAEKLRREKLITEEQFQRFLDEGAIGSHLETLQRRGGFKGFNQKSVSAIIAATDPRKQPAQHA